MSVTPVQRLAQQHVRRHQDAGDAGRDRFLLAMSLPYLAILALLSLHTKIEVNWAAPGW